MATKMAKTTLAKPGKVDQRWYLVDATDQTLGRLATKLARILMGKHKPIYTPHVDTGDFIVVINAEKIRVTGRKMETKEYQWYTGYHAGRKVHKLAEVLQKHPTWPIEWAVRRMLPKSRLGQLMLHKLKVYAGTEHPHQAQMPEPLKL